MAAATPSYIIGRCIELQGNWSTRMKKFKEWFDVLLLVDELEQAGVESVVSNDPRTGYNLAKHLLVTMTIADKISSDGLPPEFIPATAYMERYVTERWKDQEKRYRQIGRQSWLAEAVSWMLAIGWYSIFAMATKDEVWAEVWSPYDCFPEYGPDGLIEHARIYKLSAGAANRKLRVMGWIVARPFTSDVTFYDHWTFDADGDIVNAVVANTQFVKQPVKDIAVSKVGRLPIFTSAVGGLPDMGSIKGAKEWQKHYGESIVATNEDLGFQYNKMRSFVQQVARTAAQPHWFETSTGETPIATDALMDKWGSILRGAVGEDVRPLQSPTIPIELTNMLYHYQQELQRGLFPAAVFGNLQQQMSYLAMANVASAAMQVLTPYKDAIAGMRTDVDNFWQDMIIKNGFAPHRFKKPDNMAELEDTRFDVDVDLEIPGYMIQRATVARMLNPNFRLPDAWIKDKLFPEILDPLKAQADVRAEDAMMHPKAIIADQILAYEKQAELMRKANNTRGAEIYEKLAKSLEAELEGPSQVPPPAAPGQISPLQEVMPKELAEPAGGLGA